MLSLCRLSRSTFQSWRRSGLDLPGTGGAYGLNEVLTLTILVAVRDFLAPKEMVAAWRHLVRSGREEEILSSARGLERGDRFDLVIEPELASLELARSDEELVAAVRHPTYPREFVVVDGAERVYTVVDAFSRLGNETPRPRQKGPGRPRSADRNVHVLRSAENT
jgi:hypothetical protein